MKVAQSQIDDLIARSTIETYTFFDKCLVVALKLPNDFVLTGEGACVDPSEFHYATGYEVAMKQIETQLWTLLGYELQETLSRSKQQVSE